MSTQINLKNNLDTTLSITHSDGANTKVIDSTDIAVAIDTVADFPANPNNGDVVIVRDLDRGGTFIYDSSKVADSNSGTNFSGWIRQYSGAVNVKWFGAIGDNNDTNATIDTNAVQSAINYCFINDLELFLDGSFRINNTITLPQSGVKLTNPILKIKGKGGLNNYTDENVMSSLVASSTFHDTDKILLDLRYQETIPTRYTIIIDGINIFGRTTNNCNGLYISNAWTTLRDTCIKGFSEGVVFNELYKLNIDSCSITGNKWGINFSGFNSVINIMGSQLRSNFRDTEGGLFLLKVSPRKHTSEIGSNVSSLSECSFTGNNMEANLSVIELGEDTCSLQGVTLVDNYYEANTYIVKRNNYNYSLINCKLKGSISSTIELDYTDNVVIEGTGYSVTTTDATEPPNINYSGNYESQGPYSELNRYLSRYVLNDDSDFALSSHVVSPMIIPLAMMNSSISLTSWSNTDAFLPNKYYAVVTNSTGSTQYLLWQINIKSMRNYYRANASFVYRVKVKIVFKNTTNSDYIVLKSNYGGGSVNTRWITNTQNVWTTDVSTLNIPANITGTASGGTATFKLEIPNGVTLHIDRMILSYATQPIKTGNNMIPIGISIPANSYTDITTRLTDGEYTWSVLNQTTSAGYIWSSRANDGAKNNYVTRFYNTSSTTSYPFISIKPVMDFNNV